MLGDLLFPLIYAALVWWASTGVILWLIGRPRGTFLGTALGATLVLGASTFALLELRDETGLLGAYAGFAAGVLLWAWHETMFLLGYISGPRRAPCPRGLAAWPRFVASAQTVIHHELAIATHAVLIAWMSWGAANQFAALTFFLLWGMRLSAKLIVFLGAPNVAEDFLPGHLRYLASYFGKKAVTPVFPIVITIVTTVAAAIAYEATLFSPGSFAAAGFTMLAGLAALAVFEHWALVLPTPEATLWNWALRNNRGSAPNARQGIGGRHGL